MNSDGKDVNSKCCHPKAGSRKVKNLYQIVNFYLQDQKKKLLFINQKSLLKDKVILNRKNKARGLITPGFKIK